MSEDIIKLAREALEDEKRGTPGPWVLVRGSSHVVSSTQETGWIEVRASGGNVPCVVHEASCDADEIRTGPEAFNGVFIAAARTREPILARAVLDLHEKLVATSFRLDEANIDLMAFREFVRDNPTSLAARLREVRAERDEALASLAVQTERAEIAEREDMRLRAILSLFGLNVDAPTGDIARAAATVIEDQSDANWQRIDALTKCDSLMAERDAAIADAATLRGLLAEAVSHLKYHREENGGLRFDDPSLVERLAAAMENTK